MSEHLSLPDYSFYENQDQVQVPVPAPAPAPAPACPPRFPQVDEAYDEFAVDLNYWRRYNDPLGNPPDFTRQEVQDWYRLHNYVVVAPPGRPAPQYTTPRPVRPVPPPDITPKNDAERAFLASNIPEIMTPGFPAAKWKGVRVLGSGGFGLVGQWSYDKNQDSLPRFLGVAVKEATNPDHNLYDEGQVMAGLSKFSEHVTRLVRDPEVLNIPAGEPGAEWDGKVRRLIMEYCSQGTLNALCKRRIARQVPFQENTLWLLFDCLVDGITALENAIEYKVNTLTGKAELAGDSDTWIPIVHFDMKSHNMLLEKTRTHADTQIVKIADFGCAEQVDPYRPRSDRYKERRRGDGTPGYYAPEQFSPRWDYADWKTSGVCGEYGSATNVWGIGLAMWELVMMDRDPYLVDPFLPDILINGAPPKGRTFATNIEAAPYSRKLIDLVIETLYEVPAHRPDLKSLKERVTLGLEAANRLQDPELWETFRVPDPIPANAPDAAVVPPPPAPVIPAPPPPPPPPLPPVIPLVVYRCSHILDSGTQCATQKKLPLGAPNPRCHLHTDLV